MTEPNLSPADVSRLYRSLKRIRRFEEVTAEIYPSDKIKSPVHLAIGQEQVSVAVCDVLGAGDWVGGSYRSHAMYLAKGGSMPAMMAEMYGKDTGCCRGKGGSMHVIDVSAGVMGSSAVVATQIPVAAGYALAAKRAHAGHVVAVFFGDGASEEGCFYETLNFAALHALPILFICENNGYAIHEPIAKRRAKPDEICSVAESLGVPAHRVDDGDVFAIRRIAEDVVRRMRKGGGPALIEAKVYRWREHVGPNEDYDQGYRFEDEVVPWKRTDQVERLAAMVDDAARARIDSEIETEIADAVRFAEESPIPAAKEVFSDVYA
ncbi:thiamine pyrophosphate-dependent dehydrogenase E1 component subunit alpha [Magnetospirillum moscoviense]|uniref:thiamine pyrophosphate-dependent dehydrogenase E1 component subunit alpha n=1 Tax=Magnetospirillum moscoviense TaxID=1437059 RepID=UPI000B334217|nr:thiamine pyrophosphate-dependent dehydrogenase E1 component subunit alpha [Magnetospirillum moscoviense]